jgi:hypothetical protein
MILIYSKAFKNLSLILIKNRQASIFFQFIIFDHNIINNFLSIIEYV